MIAAGSIATVAAYWFVGAVLYRALVLRLCGISDAASAPPGSDRDLLLRSVLPALAIVGTIGTFLALFHLFRADVTLALGAALLLWRRHDAVSLGKAIWALARDLARAVRSGHAILLVALAAFGGTAYLLVLFSHVPTSYIDAWAFQLPLAQSIVAHHGFVYPQVSSPFYSNNPLFFNVLFAHALLFVDHFVAAGVINIAIYLGFLLCLASFAPRYRSIALLLALYLVATSSVVVAGKSVPLLSAEATMPLIDAPRSCFSVLALLFTQRYRLSGRTDELATAGLLAGAAAAGKYTELITIGLIGLALLPSLVRERRAWRDTAIFAAIVLVIAGYWYVKNLLLFGNPIYPFIFAHPGLSDEWMAGYMREMTRAFDPADRVYVTDLLTWQGWRDFALVLHNWFLGGVAAKLAAVLILIGLARWRDRIGTLAAWTAIMFAIWYALMFNSVRWAMPAYLLYLSTALIVSFFLLDLYLPKLSAIHVNLPGRAGPGGQMAARARASGWRSGSLLAGGLTAALLAGGLATRAAWHRPVDMLPSSIGGGLIGVALGRASIDDYLASHRDGYEIYRYIAAHDLRFVFQPFDNGAVDYARAYNGGHDGKWILPWGTLPSGGESIETFISENKIRYFIFRSSLKPVEIDRFGQAHIDRGNRMLAALLPRSRLLITDRFGWSLYEIGPR